LNNLAWLLAFCEPIDLDRALRFANQAVEKAPDAPQFRGTRGHILLKLKKYNEALPDLEKAIEAYPKDVKLFEALAETCEKLGDATKAAEYRERARKLQPPPNPEP
jgi:predicted Zn-dependent protease